MEREIKFRAWINKTRRMVEVSDLILMSGGGYSIIPSPYDATNKIAIGKSLGVETGNVLMQFTGVKIGGEEIYMGDIIALYKNDKEYFRGVVSDHGHCGITVDSQNDYMDFFLTNYTYKKLGNIYENPELLK